MLGHQRSTTYRAVYSSSASSSRYLPTAYSHCVSVPSIPRSMARDFCFLVLAGALGALFPLLTSDRSSKVAGPKRGRRGRSDTSSERQERLNGSITMQGIEGKGNAEEQRAAVLREKERSRTGKAAIWIPWSSGQGRGRGETYLGRAEERPARLGLRSEPASTR